MILNGDFNVDFASNDSVLLVDFLRENLHLKMINNPNEPTTRYETTIDAIFQRYLYTLEPTFHLFQRSQTIVPFLEDSDVHPTIDNEWTDVFITTHLHFYRNMNK